MKVYANRYKQVARRKSRNGKQVSVEVMRPREEWVRLPDAPAVISKETFDRIQSQIKSNKAESIHNNNKQENVGLLRAGYIFCGVCGNAMHVAPPSKAERGFIHRYCCRRDAGGNLGIECNHRTQISIKLIETAAKAKIVEALLQPELVRAKIEEIRDRLRPTFDTTDLEPIPIGLQPHDTSEKRTFAGARCQVRSLGGIRGQHLPQLFLHPFSPCNWLQQFCPRP